MGWYNREKATAYARKWALSRNEAYYDFDNLGGDCTNFISQCLYAGCGVMNYTPVYGWYYRSLNDRSPAWTGVEELSRFLLRNEGAGPHAVQVPIEDLMEGDVIQLGDSEGNFYHSLLVIDKNGTNPLVAAHTSDALYRGLDTYYFDRIRCLHIDKTK